MFLERELTRLLAIRSVLFFGVVLLKSSRDESCSTKILVLETQPVLLGRHAWLASLSSCPVLLGKLCASIDPLRSLERVLYIVRGSQGTHSRVVQIVTKFPSSLALSSVPTSRSCHLVSSRVGFGCQGARPHAQSITESYHGYKGYPGYEPETPVAGDLAPQVSYFNCTRVACADAACTKVRDGGEHACWC